MDPEEKNGRSQTKDFFLQCIPKRKSLMDPDGLEHERQHERLGCRKEGSCSQFRDAKYPTES